MTSAIDPEARRQAQEARDLAKTAHSKAEQAVEIARRANDISLANQEAIRHGFNHLEGKIDDLITQIREVRTDSMRPKVESHTGKLIQLEADLANERELSAKRLAKLEAAERARVEAIEKAQAEKVEAAAASSRAASDRKRMARRLMMAWALAFFGAIGTGMGFWLWSDVKSHLAGRNETRQTLPAKGSPP